MSKCLSCKTEVKPLFIVKKGFYKGLCVDCANEFENDDIRRKNEV
jgi:hypothetical protein